MVRPASVLHFQPKQKVLNLFQPQVPFCQGDVSFSLRDRAANLLAEVKRRAGGDGDFVGVHLRRGHKWVEVLWGGGGWGGVRQIFERGSRDGVQDR